jgi:hypothetical protein
VRRPFVKWLASPFRCRDNGELSEHRERVGLDFV